MVEDSEGGEEGVWGVKRGGDKEKFEGGRRGGDKGDGVALMELAITVFWVYSKAWVGPRGKSRVGGK